MPSGGVHTITAAQGRTRLTACPPLAVRSSEVAARDTTVGSGPCARGLLLCAAHNDLGGHANRAGRNVGQLIAREGEPSPLLRASPIRKGAALNAQDEG